MSIIDDLITDRTYGDVTSGNAKGRYDYRDYNRVGQAINYVAAEVGGLSITAKTNWINTDIPKNSEMTAYRGYVQTILDTTGVSRPIPTTNNAILTITGANQIEQALYDTHRLLQTMMRWNDLDRLNESWDTLDSKQLTWGAWFPKPN